MNIAFGSRFPLLPTMGIAACLVGASLPAQAQVKFTQGHRVLTAGQATTLSFTVGGAAVAGTGLDWSLEGNPPGAWLAFPENGKVQVLTAPELDWATLRLVATSRNRPEDRAEAVIDVLPFNPFELLGRTLGPDWMDEATGMRSGQYPFLVGAAHSGERFPGAGDGKGRVKESGESLGDPVEIGCGLPLELVIPPAPGAVARQVTWAASYLRDRDHDNVRRMDVTESKRAVVRFGADAPERVVIESMVPQAGKPGRWESRTAHANLVHRGVYPLAGAPLREPGCAEGRGMDARMHSPCGAVLVGAGTGLSSRKFAGHRNRWMVADTGNHCIWSVMDGQARVFLGTPGKAGRPDGKLKADADAGDTKGDTKADSKGGSAEGAGMVLFDQPTFLACLGDTARVVNGRPQPLPDFLVADSGNHVIRRVSYQGSRKEVFTVAGTAGVADHLDLENGDPTECLLNDPQGIAVVDDGTIFIADRGNFVIRKLQPGKGLTTLAGLPRTPGSADGDPREARFTSLRGLVCHNGVLYAADNHAVRTIDCNTGQVGTLIGDVTAASLKDFVAATPDPGSPGDAKNIFAPLKGKPCLNEPWSLQVESNRLYITCRGDNTIREFDLASQTLRTIAGDARRGGSTRWGLIRDNIQHPDERHATLDAPSGLAFDGPDTLLVTTGSCLAVVKAGATPIFDQGRPDPMTVQFDGKDAVVDGPCAVKVLLAPGVAGAQPRPVHVRVEFIAEDCPAQVHDEVLPEGATFDFKGSFIRAGKGTLRITGITQSGHSHQTELAVTVTAKQ